MSENVRNDLKSSYRGILDRLESFDDLHTLFYSDFDSILQIWRVSPYYFIIFFFIVIILIRLERIFVLCKRDWTRQAVVHRVFILIYIVTEDCLLRLLRRCVKLVLFFFLFIVEHIHKLLQNSFVLAVHAHVSLFVIILQGLILWSIF